MSNQQTLMLETLRQSSVATAIYTSAALHIGFINEGMLAIWGHTTEKETAQFPDLLTVDDQQYLASLLSDVWNQERPFRLTAYPIEIKAHGAAKLFYVDFDLQPIVNSAGETESMIHTMREVENPLLNLQSGMMQGNEILADEKLLKWSRDLSHDLRNPLSVAKLGMQYMRSRTQMTPEEQNKWVTMVIDALQSVETLITDVVEISKKQAPTPAATNVSNIVHKIFVQNQLYLGQDTSKLDFSSMLAIPADLKSVYAIFNLAIQSASQLSGCEQYMPVLISCNQITDGVQYILRYTDSEVGQQFVGYTVLEQSIQRIEGSKMVLDLPNKQLIFNFPIL